MALPDKDARDKLKKQAINKNGTEMLKVLTSARDKIQVEIIKSVKAGNLTSATWLRDNLYPKLQKQYLDLQGGLTDWTENAVKSTARQWVKLAVDDIPKATFDESWGIFSEKLLDDAINKFSPSTMFSRAAVNAGQLDPIMGGMLKKDIDSLRDVVQNATRMQAVTGMTSQQWRKEVLSGVLDRNDAWSFIDKSGRTWEAKNYFNMLNRTLVTSVANESYMSTMTENGYDLATIEGGISDETHDACAKWVGQIVSISGTSKEYPALADATSEGLFHPNCVHYLAVVLPGEEVPNSEATSI